MAAMLCFEWLIFGIIAAFEFGKIGFDGVMLPLVMSGLFGLAGVIAALFIVRRAVSNRNRSALVVMEVLCLIGLVTSAWFIDSTQGTLPKTSGNSGLGAAIYFLASAAIASVGLCIIWLRSAYEIKKKEREIGSTNSPKNENRKLG